ncbi:MAG: AAA family ATPase [Gemmatimonadales bacterium]
MRLSTLELAWFRGAADKVTLDAKGKSIVVYGTNGSGKSSFVDAVEFAINGKIAHLSHEYSGKKQERGIPNTHLKAGNACTARVTFEDDTARDISISGDGTATSIGTEVPPLSTWDYRRTVLRQDEVSAFIRDTKGDKYSALLPLLGLAELEIAAENLRHLAKAVEDTSKLKELSAVLKQTNVQRKILFGDAGDEVILAQVRSLFDTYSGTHSAPGGPDAQVDQALKDVDIRIAASSADTVEHVTLQDAAKLAILASVVRVREQNAKLAVSMEPLLQERLDVLEASEGYAATLSSNETISCPACGSRVASIDFKTHVENELDRLKSIVAIRDDRAAHLGVFCDELAALKKLCGKPTFVTWSLRHDGLREHLKYVASLDVNGLRKGCSEPDLRRVEEHVGPLLSAAVIDSRQAPTDAKVLSTDRQTLVCARSVIAARASGIIVARALALSAFLAGLEQAVRNQIKLRAESVITAISADVQAMWLQLHPGKPIDNIALYMPNATDKAIDIRLTFHGVLQDSPRLTLSEGYRNSLGLCIFLAMAKRDGHDDRPLILDDVIVSLDRMHRGLLVDVLQTEFATRQVIILTHDREWYTELRHLLMGPDWLFYTLLPYETPEVGIRWAHRTTTFDDARAHLAHRPDSAGNDARKIMDVELALIVEKLQLRLPYVRGERNDMRMAHELLTQLVTDGKKCFERREGTAYVPNPEALALLSDADRLLAAWGNRASHSFDLERAEASKLIAACEAAIGAFICPACQKPVWRAELAGPEWVQCDCGGLRWRYGKG